MVPHISAILYGTTKKDAVLKLSTWQLSYIITADLLKIGIYC